MKISQINLVIVFNCLSDEPECISCLSLQFGLDIHFILNFVYVDYMFALFYILSDLCGEFKTILCM